MGNECLTADGVAEWTQIEVDRVFGSRALAVAAREVAMDQCEQNLCRKKTRDGKHSVSQSPSENWAMIERDTIDETKMRHALRMMHGDGLRDAAADAMPDDACALDTKLVEQRDRSLGVRGDVDRMRHRSVAAPVPE